MVTGKSEPRMAEFTLLMHVCHLLPVISQGSQPCLGLVNVLQTCEAVDCLVAAWSLAKEIEGAFVITRVDYLKQKYST